MGSVCSRSQPARAWPASWNATTFLSAGDITLLFFSIPEAGSMWLSHDKEHIAYYSYMTNRQLSSQQHTQSRARWQRHLWTWQHAMRPHSQYLQCQHLCVEGVVFIHVHVHVHVKSWEECFALFFFCIYTLMYTYRYVLVWERPDGMNKSPPTSLAGSSSGRPQRWPFSPAVLASWSGFVDRIFLVLAAPDRECQPDWLKPTSPHLPEGLCL